MRVLITGRRAKALAAAGGAFEHTLQIYSAATKTACLALLDTTQFDLVLACERLVDGSGLEVLRHVAVHMPNTLRIFAARPATLNLLKAELEFFELFRTLSYPIRFRDLKAALSLAYHACGDGQEATVARVAATTGIDVRHIRPRSDTSGERAAERYAAAHVTSPLTLASVEVSTATVAAGPDQNGDRETTVAPIVPAALKADPPGPARPRAPIPESEAFKRARARRNEARLQANSRFSAAGSDITFFTANAPLTADVSLSGDARRGARVTARHSMARLARLVAGKRPIYHSQGFPGGKKKRAVLLVGSGAFAAVTIALLTLSVANGDHSIKRSKSAAVASITQPIPEQVFPWQTQPRQADQSNDLANTVSPTSTAENSDGAVDLQAERAEFDAADPGQPPSSEPQSSESPAESRDE